MFYFTVKTVNILIVLFFIYHFSAQASTLQDSAGNIYFPQELKCFTCGCIKLKADEDNLCEICHHDHFSDSNVVSPLKNSKISDSITHHIIYYEIDTIQVFEGEEFMCSFCECKNYKFDDESSECKNCHHEHFPEIPIMTNNNTVDYRFNDPSSLNNSGRFYRAIERSFSSDLKI